jgi:hypothetical protein
VNSSDANRPPDQTPASTPCRWRQQKHRGLLWFCFWVLFLTTPAAPFAAQMILQFGPLGRLPFNRALLLSGGLAAGILCAGFILARLYSNTTTQLVVKTIAFALLIVLFYGLVAFAGCMLLANAFNG